MKNETSFRQLFCAIIHIIKYTSMKISKTIPSSLFYIFGLNFAWEISQMFLYENHTKGFADFIFVHFKASLGDVIIFTIIYVFGILIFGDKKWFLQKTIFTYPFVAIFGFIIAVSVEKYALATGRWEYGNLMPIIPILKVGLLPVLQMIFLPIISIQIIKKQSF